MNYGIQILHGNEMIFNSFKYSGISYSLDGGEDSLFRGYKFFFKLESGNSQSGIAII